MSTIQGGREEIEEDKENRTGKRTEHKGYQLQKATEKK
jgi:hypothetical protein